MSEGMAGRNNYIAIAPPVVLMILIFVSSSIPGRLEDGGFKFLVNIDPQLQNLLHVPLFGVLQFLWLQALTRMKRTVRKAVVISLPICLVYACLDELHQMFVPGRYASLADILLNVTGVILGVLLFIILKEHGSANAEG